MKCALAEDARLLHWRDHGRRRKVENDGDWHWRTITMWTQCVSWRMWRSKQRNRRRQLPVMSAVGCTSVSRSDSVQSTGILAATSWPICCLKHLLSTPDTPSSKCPLIKYKCQCYTVIQHKWWGLQHYWTVVSQSHTYNYSNAVPTALVLDLILASRQSTHSLLGQKSAVNTFQKLRSNFL